MSQPTSIGILGLGIIGSRVAENLRQAGHTVQVWSHTARAIEGAQPSPQAVAGAAKVIQIFVRDGQALLQAVRDMQPMLTAEHVIINHATVSKEQTLAAADLCQEKGAAFLDAPFTGSKMAAQNAKLVYYIGGSAEVLERVRSILEISSTKILPLGEVGDAMVLKIVTNLVTAVTVKAVAEAAAITHSQGIPLPHLLTALENNANYSALIGMKLPAIIKEDFEAHFSLRNMLKDADFARDLAAQAELPTPALDCTAAVMRNGVTAGHGDEDFSIIGKISA
jgi:3-hydroxyisobutyrate dehydrogenase-like beta-hydroxyacid dehydrogenase